MAAATFYDILGVAPEATTEAIRSAYRQRAKQMHPDVGGDAEAFKRLSEAYATLKDPGRRALYLALTEAREREVADRRPVRGPAVWLNLGVALGYTIVAVMLFVGGDEHPHYNGWLVGAGWAFAVLAWRTYSDRNFALKSPVKSLLEGGLILLLSALLFVWRLVLTFAVLAGLLCLAAAAEWLYHHLR